MGVEERKTKGESASQRGERDRAGERKREKEREREREREVLQASSLRGGGKKPSAAVLCYCVWLKEENSGHPG